MAKYRYTGYFPFAATLRWNEEGKAINQDVQVAKGEEIELPETHITVRHMVTNGLLQPLDTVNKPTK